MSENTGLSRLLLSALNSPKPLEAVLQASMYYLQRSMYLVDFTGKILGFTRVEQPQANDLWNTFCNRGYIDVYTHKVLFLAENFDENLTSYPISNEDTTFACLAVQSDSMPLNDDEQYILDTLCQALLLLLEQSQVPYHKPAKEVFFYKLLETSSASKQYVNECCKIVGMAPATLMQLMVVCNSQNITDLPVFDIAANNLIQILPGAIFAHHNNRLVVLYNHITIDKAFADVNGLMTLLTEYHLTAAVSLPFSHMASMHQAYIQTLQALDEGLAVDCTDNLYLYQDYLPYHALSYVKNDKDFCHPCIHFLMSVDAVHKTEYTKTLYTYIMNFRSQHDTAKQMNIHYNTLKYRLKKIQSLLDFPLENNEEFLLLYLSFKRMRLNGHIF